MSRVFIGSSKGFLVDGTARKGMTINGDLLVNGPIVCENAGVTLKANTLAALSASTIGTFDGQRAYVPTVKGYFSYATGSVRSADGRTVLTTPAGGNTRWLFDENFSHPEWRYGRNHWYINPTTGNDENDGLTSGAPIKHGMELYRRWGHGNTVAQDGSDPNFAVNVHVLGDITGSDALPINVVLEGGTQLRVIGEGTSTTRIGTVSSVTAENQTTNQGWEHTDAGATWVAGERIRYTSGTANTAVSWVAKNLGSNVARVSNPGISTESIYGVVPTSATPNNGSTYAVERLTKINLGHLNFEQLSNTIDFGVNINFINLEVQAVGTNLQCFHAPKSLNQVQITFYQCKFVGEIESYGCYFANCLMISTFVGRRSTYVYGGLFLDTLIEWHAGEEGQIQNDAYVQGGAGILIAINATLGNLGVFDTTTSGLNALGDGITVGPPGPTSNQGLTMVKFGGRIFGTGSLGYGIHVRNGCSAAAGTAPTIRGVRGDFACGPGGRERAFSEATGAATAVISPTWTNWNLATGSGGFGGNAHDYPTDSHMLTFT